METREEIIFVKKSKQEDENGKAQVITQVHRQTFEIDPSITVVSEKAEKRDKNDNITRERVKGVSDKKHKISHRNNFYNKNQSLPQDVIDWQNDV